MRLKDLSPEQWADWLDSPITGAVKAALGETLKRQAQSCQAAYMAGRAWPEAERLALVRMVAWHDDFFTASYDEIMAAIEDAE